MPSKREGYDPLGEEPSNCSIRDSDGEISNLTLGDMVGLFLLDVGPAVCYLLLVSLMGSIMSKSSIEMSINVMNVVVVVGIWFNRSKRALTYCLPGSQLYTVME